MSVNTDTTEQIADKRILIFGGTGSLGKTLLERFSINNTILVFSRDEAKQWTIKNEMNCENVSFCVGDIRDKGRVLDSILKFRPNIVIIAAALKQVDTCERAPNESIKTNIVGIQNVIEVISDRVNELTVYAADRGIPKLESVLLVSTDKACSPINVYGMCKAIAERLIASCASSQSHIKFVAVRYGNVLESRGSIIPLFKYQSENNDAITVTHKDMTRYVMTLNQSVDLIETTILRGKTGETWIPNLPSMKIMNLAEIFSEMHSKEIRVTGMRAGEKIHEDLINVTESMRTQRRGDYCVIAPSNVAPFNCEDYVMNSAKSLMTKEQLKNYLEDLEILQKSLSQFVGKNIEDIRTDLG